MNNRYFYDIRDSKKALDTLLNITNVPKDEWENIAKLFNGFNANELVENLINKYGILPITYQELEFVFIHITTSANNCASIRKNGLFDLQESCKCNDSELKKFLDENGVEVFVDEECLIYKDQEFDISYLPSEYCISYTTSWYIKNIARKFYFDFAICGFLSINERVPYGGYIHTRPEILADIDALLETKLSEKWYTSHSPYEIVAVVKGKDILYQGDDSATNKDILLSYLITAFFAYMGYSREEVIVLKNKVRINKNCILEINPLNYWIDYRKW